MQLAELTVLLQVAWKVHDSKGYLFGDPLRQESCHAHSVAFDSSNSHMLVCDLGTV